MKLIFENWRKYINEMDDPDSDSDDAAELRNIAADIEKKRKPQGGVEAIQDLAGQAGIEPLPHRFSNDELIDFIEKLAEVPEVKDLLNNSTAVEDLEKVISKRRKNAGHYSKEGGMLLDANVKLLIASGNTGRAAQLQGQYDHKVKSWTPAVIPGAEPETDPGPEPSWWEKLGRYTADRAKHAARELYKDFS